MNKRNPPRATVIFDQVKQYAPITKNQELAAKAWDDNKHIILSGSPGTGKTFLAMYFGLRAVLSKGSGYDKLVVVRSIVPTRDIGFLPGDEKEKKEAYMKPYIGVAAELTDDPGAWGKLLAARVVQFESTSFARGITIDNAVIFVDEMQNLNFHELDTITSRVGENCRVIFCGDYHQSDLQKNHERQGLSKFLEIMSLMKDVETIKFGWEDIVRSDFVRDYIMTKEMLEKKNGK